MDDAVAALLAELSPDERALLTVALRARAEPIAIVGIGCRVPGAAGDPDSLWRLFRDGVDAVSEIPRDRFDVDAYHDPDPDAAGKMVTRHAALLDDVDGFDAAFFEISPREAAGMDPQQRVLLEVVWEALEDAGQAAAERRRGATGVFIGGCWRDHEHAGDLAAAGAHTLTGELASVLSGRVSQTFGLEGPSLTVDTACSSSLVAVHLACQSLSAGHCALAVAGGVNLILGPDAFVKLSRMRTLSPEGRCRSFDAAANGFARGEGAGVVVLKRLVDAERDGDRVWAVVRGSAVNHDGRGAGLAAPNGRAQAEVLRAAIASAGVTPAQLAAIEAHGTGTPLGDPVELEALKEVLGGPRADGTRCAVSSAKGNVGHLEAAAGVVGLLRAVLMLRHGVVPAQLHHNRLNPRVTLDGTPLFVPTTPQPLRAAAGPRFAGVSSFGISGTNAHVVVAEAPERAPAPRPARSHQVIPLAAKSDGALRELAARVARALTTEPAPTLEDVAFSAASRAPHAFRCAVVAATRDEAVARLLSFAAGAGVAHVTPARGQPRVAFHLRDGVRPVPTIAALVDGEPELRRVIERCDALFRPLLRRSLFEELLAPSGARLAERALRFAVQLALGAFWRDLGVEPAVTVGEGVHAIAAACVDGSCTLERGVELLAGWSDAGAQVAPASASAAGCAVHLELGALDERDESGEPGTWIGSLPGEGGARGGAEQLCLAVAALYLRGVPLSMTALHRERPGRRVSLPTYPFQRQPLPSSRRPPPARSVRSSLAGERLASPLAELQFERLVDAPATPGELLARVIAAVDAVTPGRDIVLTDVVLHDVVPAGRRRSHVILTPRANGYAAAIASAPEDPPASSAWTRELTCEVPGEVAGEAPPLEPPRVDGAGRKLSLPAAATLLERLDAILGVADAPSRPRTLARLIVPAPREPGASRADLWLLDGEGRMVGAIAALAGNPAPPPAMIDDLVTRIGGLARAILRLDPALALHPDQRLDELGLDSLFAIELADAIADTLGIVVPTTIALEHRTVAAIARHLAGTAAVNP